MAANVHWRWDFAQRTEGDIDLADDGTALTAVARIAGETDAIAGAGVVDVEPAFDGDNDGEAAAADDAVGGFHVEAGEFAVDELFEGGLGEGAC